MTCSDLFSTALALIGTYSTDSGLDDYEARALPLISVVCSELLPISHILRNERISDKAIKLDNLSSKFPLDERLFSSASHLLAARLIFDEDISLAASLELKGSSLAEAAVPKTCEIGKIKEVHSV